MNLWPILKNSQFYTLKASGTCNDVGVGLADAWLGVRLIKHVAYDYSLFGGIQRMRLEHSLFSDGLLKIEWYPLLFPRVYLLVRT